MPVLDNNACSNDADGCSLYTADTVVNQLTSPDLSIEGITRRHSNVTPMAARPPSYWFECVTSAPTASSMIFTVRVVDYLSGWSSSGTYDVEANGPIAVGSAVDVLIDTSGWISDCTMCEAYDLEAEVDAEEEICECTETNNSFRQALPSECAEIGDTVWRDDNDGIQETGEEGIEGATVRLYTPDDVLIDTTTTDSLGKYIFTGLLPGDYYVEFDKSTAINAENLTLSSPPIKGTNDNEDSDASIIVDPNISRTIVTTLDPRRKRHELGRRLLRQHPRRIGQSGKSGLDRHRQ